MAIRSERWRGIGTCPQHREPRVGPEHHTGPSLSRVYGEDPSGRPNPLTHCARGNSSTRGCDSICGRIWRRAARPSRLPDASDARVRTTCESPHSAHPRFREATARRRIPASGRSWSGRAGLPVPTNCPSGTVWAWPR